MIRHNTVLFVALATVVATPSARAQQTASELLRLSTPALDIRETGLPGGPPEFRSYAGYDREAKEALPVPPTDYNARLGIRAVSDDRHIEPFLLIGAAAGGLLGYAVYRRRDPSRDPYIRTFALASGVTLGVGVGALAYFIGPPGPSDREPPTPQPPADGSSAKR